MGETIGNIISREIDFEGMNYPQVLDAQARRRGEKVWIVHEEQTLTFRAFSEATDHLAAALRMAGLGKGEPCALWYPNGIRYALLQFAILKAGAVLLPLNTRYRSHEIGFMLAFSGAGFLLMVPQFLKADFVSILNEVRGRLPELRQVYVESAGAPQGMRDIEELFRYRATPQEIGDLREQAVSDTAPASILFTSGTTSQPKGVLGSHRARVWAGMGNAERMRIGEDDVLLNPLPFCHEFGGFTVPSHALLCGCTMVIMETFSAEEALRLVQKHKVSVLYGVPTMFSSMIHSPDLEKTDLSSLRTGYMSGAICPVELVRAVQERMGCNISVAYGLSEIPCHTICDYDDPPQVKRTTLGRPVRGGDAKIVDEHRLETPVGAPGEIALRGLNRMIGYYKNPEATAKTIDRDGFLYTNDIGTMDAKGYLTFLGRKTDLIVAGGFNIYPLEVEEVLYELPFVERAAVVGLPDKVKEEIVVACVVLRDGMQATEEEIVAHCRKKLANYKVPRRVEFMTSFPATVATDKVKKLELAALLQQKS